MDPEVAELLLSADDCATSSSEFVTAIATFAEAEPESKMSILGVS